MICTESLPAPSQRQIGNLIDSERTGEKPSPVQILHCYGPEPITQLLDIQTFRHHGFPKGLPIAILDSPLARLGWRAGKEPRAFVAHLAEAIVLGRGRLLTNHAAATVPSDVVRAGPAVSAAHIQAVL